MKAAILNKETFVQHYPEKKPICLNYAVVREDILALIEENEALHFLLTQHALNK